jgi:hypothetical protein
MDTLSIRLYSKDSINLKFAVAVKLRLQYVWYQSARKIPLLFFLMNAKYVQQTNNGSRVNKLRSDVILRNILQHGRRRCKRQTDK